MVTNEGLREIIGLDNYMCLVASEAKDIAEDLLETRRRLALAEKVVEAAKEINKVPSHGEYGGPLVYLNALYEDGSEWWKPHLSPEAQKRHIGHHQMAALRDALTEYKKEVDK